MRALHLLQNADIVFYDELVAPEILARARRDAELVLVGKRKGEPGIGQDEINRRLVDAARAGKQVVRLKGGDPFIFGRGGEELEHLREAGIATFVVPGVTAALGCAAEAGLPLTFRKEASQLSFVTANTADGAQAVDWRGLSDPHTTVVVYMGLSCGAACARRLDRRRPQSGRRRPPCSRAARGPTRKRQLGTLDELPALAASVGEGPGFAGHRRGRRARRRLDRAQGKRFRGGRMTAPAQQKLKIKGPVVVTANRLGDGAVVYRAAVGGWTTRLDAAAVVTTAPDASDLLAAADADGIAAVDPYVAPVALADGRIEPGNLRERIRLGGPTFDLPASFGI